MCVLCGEFVMNIHWTDSKPYSFDNSSTVVVGQFQREHRRARIHRANLANQILKYYGLKLKDWNGSKFQLTSNKGKIEVIHDMGELWPSVEKMIGHPLDPLSPDLLKQMNKDEME